MTKLTNFLASIDASKSDTRIAIGTPEEETVAQAADTPQVSSEEASKATQYYQALKTPASIAPAPEENINQEEAALTEKKYTEQKIADLQKQLNETKEVSQQSSIKRDINKYEDHLNFIDGNVANNKVTEPYTARYYIENEQVIAGKKHSGYITLSQDNDGILHVGLEDKDNDIEYIQPEDIKSFSIKIDENSIESYPIHNILAFHNLSLSQKNEDELELHTEIHDYETTVEELEMPSITVSSSEESIDISQTSGSESNAETASTDSEADDEVAPSVTQTTNLERNADAAIVREASSLDGETNDEAAPSVIETTNSKHDTEATVVKEVPHSERTSSDSESKISKSDTPQKSEKEVVAEKTTAQETNLEDSSTDSESDDELALQSKTTTESKHDREYLVLSPDEQEPLTSDSELELELEQETKVESSANDASSTDVEQEAAKQEQQAESSSRSAQEAAEQEQQTESSSRSAQEAVQTASEPAKNKPEEQAQSTQDSTQSSHTDSTTEYSSSDSKSEHDAAPNVTHTTDSEPDAEAVRVQEASGSDSDSLALSPDEQEPLTSDSELELEQETKVESSANDLSSTDDEQEAAETSNIEETTEDSSTESQSAAEKKAVIISEKEQQLDAEASSLDGEPETEDIAKAASSAEESSKLEKKTIVDLTELESYIEAVEKFNNALTPIENEIVHVKAHLQKFETSQMLSDDNKFTQADKDALNDIKAKIALIKQSANDSINKLQKTANVLENLKTDLSEINQDEVILQFSDTKIQSPDEIKSKIEALSQQIEKLKEAQEQLKDNIETALNTDANSFKQLETKMSELNTNKTQHVQKEITIKNGQRQVNTKKADYSDGALKQTSSTGIKYSQSANNCSLKTKNVSKGTDETTGLSNYAVTCVEMLYNQYTERGTTKEYPIETYDIETVQIICAAAKAIGIPKEKLHFWAKQNDGNAVNWPDPLVESTYAAMSTHKNISLEPFDGTKLGENIASPQDFYTQIKSYTQTIQAFEHRDLEAGFKNKRKLKPQALGTSIDNIGFFENNADRNVRNFVAQGNEVHESLKLKK